MSSSLLAEEVRDEAAAAGPQPPARRGRKRFRRPSLESLFVATLVLVAFRLGAHPISDNSMLVHLRTGIAMVGGRGIPRVDPYSFTAHGAPWVVQSWLAVWTYGVLDRLGGLQLVALQQAFLMAALAWLMLRLVRTGDALRTAAGGIVVLAIGAPWWAPRPLLFGLLGMALTVTIVERRRSPWLLVPVLWVWVSTHGSFPLAALWLGGHLVGSRLDGRRLREELRYAGAMAVGFAVAAVNPLGPRLLTFALSVGEKRAVFANIVEWRSPDFQSPQGLVTAAGLGLALVVLLRGKPAWRHVLPAAGFVIVGLLSLRNLPVAAVVLAPAVGRALRPTVPAPAAPAPGRMNLAFLGVLLTGFLVLGASVLTGPGVALDSYPVAAVRYLERSGLRTPDHRIATPDVVGCYLVARYGADARVFIDDRYDMYPLAVSEDYLTLYKGRPGALDVLDRRDVDVVLWHEGDPLVAILDAGGRWHRVFARDGWVVYRR